eukprot:CAMPEP_0118922310 /NCGR_PEP_ID=MMETSP1169-20130426/1282_1 /TAXON_ID=36882 /ORGANISM="Pyramimonas obovata, Strain CCMP722" /LENGTH=159 /DNA_ID=CAMNT_0006863155 /DNA_START=210 /DNA_END=689 /DNA_ORIENTATION=+
MTFKGQTWGDNHLAELRDKFSLFDTDADGYLSVQELKDLLTQMDFQNPTSKHIDNMLKQAGLDKKDQIDFPELLMLVTVQMNILEEMNDEDQLHDALQLFDKDKNGQIDLAELTNVVGKVGSKISAKDMSVFLKRLEEDTTDGKVSMDDFIRLMRLAAE